MLFCTRFYYSTTLYSLYMCVCVLINERVEHVVADGGAVAVAAAAASDGFC